MLPRCSTCGSPILPDQLPAYDFAKQGLICPTCADDIRPKVQAWRARRTA